MKLLLATTAIICLCATTAESRDYKRKSDPPGSPTTVQLNQASAAASAKATAAAVATGGQASGGSASASVGAVSGGSVKNEKQAPAIGGLPSGPCTGMSGGLTTPIGGLIIGATDSQCTLRNNINTVSQFDPDLAKEMLSDLDGVKAARERMGK